MSTFDRTTDDFMEIFNWAKSKASEFVTDFEVSVIKEGKVITMGNVTDMEKFQAIMTSEEMKAWNTKHNCVDVIYALENNKFKFSTIYHSVINPINGLLNQSPPGMGLFCLYDNTV